MVILPPTRYAWLLIFPRMLSAEYSFNCVPAVTSASNVNATEAVDTNTVEEGE